MTKSRIGGKLLSLLITLCVVVSLFAWLGIPAGAAPEPPDYTGPLYFYDGVFYADAAHADPITVGAYTDLSGLSLGGDAIEGWEITLDNVTFDGISLIISGDTTLVVNGTNTINGVAGLPAIQSDVDLTIVSGADGGSLVCTGADTSDAWTGGITVGSDGAGANLTLEDRSGAGLAVTGASGDATGNDRTTATGVYVYGDITVGSGCTLKGTASPSPASEAFGIFASGSIDVTGEVYAEVGDVFASENPINTFGIAAGSTYGEPVDAGAITVHDGGKLSSAVYIDDSLERNANDACAIWAVWAGELTSGEGSVLEASITPLIENSMLVGISCYSFTANGSEIFAFGDEGIHAVDEIDFTATDVWVGGFESGLTIDELIEQFPVGVTGYGVHGAGGIKLSESRLVSIVRVPEHIADDEDDGLYPAALYSDGGDISLLNDSILLTLNLQDAKGYGILVDSAGGAVNITDSQYMALGGWAGIRICKNEARLNVSGSELVMGHIDENTLPVDDVADSKLVHGVQASGDDGSMSIDSSTVNITAREAGIDMEYYSALLVKDSEVTANGEEGCGLRAKVIEFAGLSQVDAVGLEVGIASFDKINYELTAGGRVTGTCSGGDNAGVAAYSGNTITLAQNNVITTPSGGKIVVDGGMEYIGNSDNTMASTGTVQYKVKSVPNTGSVGIGLASTLLVFSALGLGVSLKKKRESR